MTRGVRGLPAARGEVDWWAGQFDGAEIVEGGRIAAPMRGNDEGIRTSGNP